MSGPWDWVAIFIGGGIVGTLANLVMHWVGFYTTARTDFQDNLLGRVHKLEGRIEHLREEHNKLQSRARAAEQENRQLKAMLKHLLKDHNRLREEQGLEPLDFDTIENEAPFVFTERT